MPHERMCTIRSFWELSEQDSPQSSAGSEMVCWAVRLLIGLGSVLCEFDEPRGSHSSSSLSLDLLFACPHGCETTDNTRTKD